MFEFFKNLWWGIQYPWPRSALKKIRPVRISLCPAHRLPECVALYERNIPHGLPASHLSEYSAIIHRGQSLVLIVEEDDTLLATFSLSRYARISQVSLSYVLVAPEHHRSGIGTTIFFAAVALLSPKDYRTILGITALPTSAPFYQKLGFVSVGKMKDPGGYTLQISSVFIWAGMATDSHLWLKNAGVEFAAHGSTIPEIEPPEDYRSVTRSG